MRAGKIPCSFFGGTIVKKANIISAILGMCVSAFAFGYTFTFKKFKNVAVGPEFFPRALAVLLFACCLVLLVQNLIPLLKGVSDTKENPTLSLRNPGIQKALLGLLIIILFAVLWNFLGFLIVTPPAVFGMILLLGKKTYLMNAIVSVGITILIFLVFKFLLGITMPLGFMENLF